MERHKELFLRKAKEIGFSIPGIGIVDSPDNEDKAKEWLETKEGSQEAARYCLVCGHIPFTPENVGLVGDGSWYIGGEQIPEEMHQKLIDYALEEKKNWVMDDDYEMEHLALLSTELDGIHIESGRVIDVKVGQTRRIRVYQTYYTPTIDRDLF